MLKGLEISEVRLSALDDSRRIDAEFFQPEHLAVASTLSMLRTESVADVASISDGNHSSITDDFVEMGVPYYRGQDVVEHFFIEQSVPRQISWEAYGRRTMKRSHLKRGDVLISIVGTVGEVGLVSSERDATCSCKVAILRSKSIDPAYLATFLASRHGYSQTTRWKRGAVQTGLLLEDMSSIRIPCFSPSLVKSISKLVGLASKNVGLGRTALEESDQLLIRVLGVNEWNSPDVLTYERLASEVLGSGRLDSAFHHPLVPSLLSHLRKRFELRELGSLKGEVTSGRTIPYTESGPLKVVRSGDLVELTEDRAYLRTDESTAVFRLAKGDVLISSIGFGSIGKVQVFDLPGDYATVSEVTVVRQSALNPWYLMSFLRNRAGQAQIERYITGATGQLHLYPRDVRLVEVPVVPESTQAAFETYANKARLARLRARSLLDLAKRAVEVAIEDSEASALTFIEEKLDGLDHA